jgi:hypothetical protein
MGSARLAAGALLAAALALAPRAHAQTPDPGAAPPKPLPAATLADTQVDWVASFPEALRLARETKRPILIAFNMDAEIANDAMVRDVYRDRKFVEQSRKFVCVIASVFKHEEPAGASGSPECARFGRVSCAQHKDCEIRAREALLGGTDVVAPQHVICTAEGTVVARRAWQMSLKEMSAWVDHALKVSGPASELAPADLKAEKARIATLFEQAEKARQWKKGEVIDQIIALEDDVAHECLDAYVMKGKDDEARVAILDRYGVAGEYTHLDVLRKAAKDGHAYVALAAVDSLGRTRLPEVKEDLKKLLGSFSAGNDYGRVLRAYANCGRDDKAVRELVLKKAKGSDQNVRVHAIVALGRMEPAPEIAEFLKKALADGITNARGCAAWAVGMGRYKECRKELEHLAATESVQDLKELATLALSHLDHEPGNKECCGLEGKIASFVTLGDTRR